MLKTLLTSHCPGPLCILSLSPKQKTDKRPKKKKILSYSDPKVSKDVKVPSLKKPVAETQHAEETVATADNTHSTDASVSVEELGNQLMLIMESLVKKKQEGAILELKMNTFKNTISWHPYTP
ncbi:hypothetical protein Tco_0819567 [Tanacetum coccineum]|uniref:Uncharacterized protein n=1 Tax=Tanacetum coccineum TaxID=301880 RepID=A0ABQ5AB62_9ASTR